MINEIPIESKESEKDDSSFDKDTNTRIMEMSLTAYKKEEVSLNNNSYKDTKKIQAPFSKICKNNENLKDDDLIY